MKHTGGLLQKQGHFLLQNEKYAWFLTAVLAVIPFTAWVSLSVMALVTLRKGWASGCQCLIIGLTVSLCMAEMTTSSPYLLSTIALTYLTCYMGACLLRATASWQKVAVFIISLATVVILLVHSLASEFILAQYKMVQEMLKALDQGNVIASLLEHQPPENQVSLANYLLGIKAISVLLSAVFSLLVARAVQSMLFYPGGFKREVMAFRANSAAVVLLLVCLYGVYQHNPVLLSCLPLFFVYLMAAGISLSLSLLAQKRRLAFWVLLLMPIVVVPYIMLPVYVLFGSIDSLFNLRARRLFLAGENQNKG
ncbi:membrane protein [Legionella rubrilucens]|uniref:Membrane protein n=1 Tax=Legionella rubrilucens TaxID=458 RepID=A0A0W0XXV9_9GAMM|nr:hypothetical protein [Legionella rubrilucens]KTD49516.1 membrane protein [Legionella rubrilucens]